MKTYLFSLIGLLIIGNSALKAQDSIAKTSAGVKGNQATIVRVNLTSIATRNLSFSLERSLNRRFSAGLAFNYMPNGGLPLKSYFEDQINGDENGIKRTIKEFEVSGFTFTPELRFYLGKGFGKGFYIAPFYRFSNYTPNFDFYYDDNLGITQKIAFEGSVTAHTGGVAFGSQFFIGKHIVLDWQIIGAHYGKSNGDLNGTYNRTLTPVEQEDAEQVIESTEIPLTKIKADVGPNRTKLTIDGPWGGIRAGISIGFRF